MLRGIYALRSFCLEKETNGFVVSEKVLQQEDEWRDLIYRLLDYRIIHSAGAALTHKSQGGTYHAFVIDIGCYAHMRTHVGRFSEIDVADAEAKERFRSAPILSSDVFRSLQSAAPQEIEEELLRESREQAAGVDA